MEVGARPRKIIARWQIVEEKVSDVHDEGSSSNGSVVGVGIQKPVAVLARKRLQWLGVLLLPEPVLKVDVVHIAAGELTVQIRGRYLGRIAG